MASDVVALTEQLVAIPSVREGEAEGPIAKWLTDYLHERFPHLQVHHQQLRGERFNIVASDGAPCRLLFAGHMDTLPIGAGWTREPFGERVGDRLYGRGALDMKGGIAAFLTALEDPRARDVRGVSLLLYCDEEYDFEGMRLFLSERDRFAHPGLVICPEPTQLEIRNGCRGLVELHVVVRGRTGHAARPASGRSAFDAFTAGLRQLEALLAAHAHADFGAPTRNVASVRCGQLLETTGDDRALLGDRANVIPDFAESVIEVRTVPGIDARDCLDAFTVGVQEADGTVASATTKFDLRSYRTPRNALGVVEAAQQAVLGNARYANLGLTGYTDIQLLATRWDVPCIMLGPSGASSHATDEYVDCASLESLRAMFVEAILRSGT